MYKKNMEIIIPTWNRAKYLDRTLSQFANSPFREYKITILNNNSTDNNSTDNATDTNSDDETDSTDEDSSEETTTKTTNRNKSNK